MVKSRGPAAEPTLVEYSAVLWRRRWLIVLITVLTVSAVFVWSMLSTKIYEGKATLLTPRETGFLGGLAASGLLQQVPGIQLPSFTPNRDILLGVLKSRTIAATTVEKFRLVERYEVKFPEDAIRQLAKRTDISTSREGVIVVSVEDKDPFIAADIANFLVSELDRLITTQYTGGAGRQRAFLAEQVARAKGSLEVAEEDLKRFQERHRAIALPEQTKGAIDASARLRAELATAEVQLKTLRGFATEANPDVIMVRRRIEELRRQLMLAQYGEMPGRRHAPNGNDYAIPFPRVPEVGLELARLTREVKIQETLVNLLTQQFEQLRILEANDVPSVQILDVALPAHRHSRPRVSLNVAVAALVSLTLGVFIAFVLELGTTVRRQLNAANVGGD